MGSFYMGSFYMESFYTGLVYVLVHTSQSEVCESYQHTHGECVRVISTHMESV